MIFIKEIILWNCVTKTDKITKLRKIDKTFKKFMEEK